VIHPYLEKFPHLIFTELPMKTISNYEINLRTSMFVINKEITIKSDPLSIEKIGKIDKDRLEKLWANSKTGNKMLKISYQRG
jgi:hypothetical protein